MVYFLSNWKKKIESLDLLFFFFFNFEGFNIVFSSYTPVFNVILSYV